MTTAPDQLTTNGGEPVFTLRREPGKATVRAYGPDGIGLAGFLQYLSDAYRVVERDTGKSPMCFVAPFADETGQGTEVTVIPSDVPAGARIIS